MAAIQYSWDWLKVKPKPLSLGTIALGKNHATKHRVKLTVVIVRVCHASLRSHFFGSSGSQVTSQSPRVSILVFILQPRSAYLRRSGTPTGSQPRRGFDPRAPWISRERNTTYGRKR